jgi:hypothetical protein
MANYMNRIAFTIILNGKHHLLHNDYYKFMLNNFKYWIVVEGASDSTGSTSWCRKMDDSFHKNGFSVDGTSEFLEQLSNLYSNMVYVKPDGLWPNKDVQVNRAIAEVKKLTDKCFLWEIDIDEQWIRHQLEVSEKQMTDYNIKTGCFHCNYYVGKDLLARGQWGEGIYLPYRRLWDWNGEMFKTHEPPELEGNNERMVLLTAKFNHYSMYFEQDVIFKDKWYSGHEGIHARWIKLQNDGGFFPRHIRELLGTNTHWGNTNTAITKVGIEQSYNTAS